MIIVGKKQSIPASQRNLAICQSWSQCFNSKSGKGNPSAPLICKSAPPNDIQSSSKSITGSLYVLLFFCG